MDHLEPPCAQTQGSLRKWGPWLQLTLQGQEHPSSGLHMDGAFMVKHSFSTQKVHPARGTEHAQAFLLLLVSC